MSNKSRPSRRELIMLSLIGFTTVAVFVALLYAVAVLWNWWFWGDFRLDG